MRKGTLRKPEVWDALVNSKFEGQPILSAEESVAAARKLYRHAMGKPWAGPVRVVSGNRYTWVRDGVLSVNPDKREVHTRGLRSIIHDLSHYCHYRLHPKDAPHSRRQAQLEGRLAKFAIDRGWHEGKPVRAVRAKPEKVEAQPEPKAKPDQVKVRYDRMVARRDKWQRELDRAKRLLTKAEREVRAYQRRHKERVTG